VEFLQVQLLSGQPDLALSANADSLPLPSAAPLYSKFNDYFNRIKSSDGSFIEAMLPRVPVNLKSNWGDKGRTD